ncbi:MAG: efflux RND transporter permease subunit [Planctomycetota bacterium]
MKGLAQALFDRPRAIVLLLGLVAVAGLTSISVLPRMEDPVLKRRAGLIATRMPGAAADRVETLVTEPIEEELLKVDQIKKFNSESRAGVSVISVELLDSIDDVEEVWAEVRTRLGDAVAKLPQDASRPTFEEIEVRAYAMIVSVTWNDPSPANAAILRRMAKELEDRLLAVPTTEVIDRFGDPGEEITIRVDIDRLASLGLSVPQLADRIRAADVKNSAGAFRTEDQQFVVTVDNELRLAGKLADIVIGSDASGQSIAVGDVATIERRVPHPIRKLATIDGKEAVTLGVMVRSQSRIDTWRERIDDVLDEFKSELPPQLDLCISLDQNRYVSERLSTLAGNLVMGATGVLLVIWLLMGWRSALMVSIALPLSICTVLFGLRVMGIPIHQMSVTGLIIALGLLIDNAIVAVDEIEAELRDGHGPFDAVGRVVGHLAIPLLGSTLTTIFAFAPIALMDGPAGEFVGAISISVMLAVSASLFFSLTIIPVLTAKFLGRRVGAGVHALATDSQVSQSPKASTPTKAERAWMFVRSTYASVIHRAIQKPLLGIAFSLLLPITGFVLASGLSEQFFPPSGRDQFLVEVELSPSASIKATREATAIIDPYLKKAGANQISWFYGESAPRFYYNVMTNRRGVENYVGGLVQLDSAEDLSERLRLLQEQLDPLLPEARVLVRQLEQGPPFAAPVEIRLYGPDLDRLRSLGDELRLILSTAPEVTHTRSVLGESFSSIDIRVDEPAARRVGLTPTDITRQVFGYLDGVPGGQILEDNEILPIVVRMPDFERGDMSRLRSIPLVANSASTLTPTPQTDSRGTVPSVRTIPLQAVADVSVAPDMAAITRMDRRRMNEVSAYIQTGTLPADTLNYFKEKLEEQGFELPSGYTLEYGGEASQRDQAVGNLMANVGVLLVMMVATLVLSFSSFRMAAIIGLVGVFSMGLGMIGLSVGGHPFGFMAIIGTMGLIGVAINDSIVVLAALRAADCKTTEQARDVVVRASRHIFATTLTTIVGFMPLILGGGGFWPPLALAIAGGVIGATVLALVMVPAIYWLVRPQRSLSAVQS